MGNCAFAGGDGPSSPMIKVVTSDGGVMELDPPVTAERITAAFPGYAVFPNRDLSSSPLLHTDNLAAGELYYLFPLTTRAASSTPLPSVTAPYRVSFDRHAALFCRRLKTEADSPTVAAGVWKVKLAISRAELAEILGEETRTEALIESVRAMAMCTAGGSSGSTASDLWSLSSSRKTSSEALAFSCSAGRFRRRMWGPDNDMAG